MRPYCVFSLKAPTPRATATGVLARRLMAELATIAGDRPMQWGMLLDVMGALGAMWEEAEQAADFAAAQGWVEHRMHSLLLREPGRNVLNGERRP
jgi:hypothetical protein